MKIVIDIPKEMWERIKDGYVPLGISKYLKNGTPLPKGHGRLLDENVIYENVDKDLNWVYDLSDIFDYIAGLPAVIPAESE